MSAISPCDEAAAKQRYRSCFDVFTSTAYHPVPRYRDKHDVLFIHTSTHSVGSIVDWFVANVGRGVVVGGERGGGFPFILTAKGTGLY